MARLPFSGSIPDDLLYCPAHDMWLQDLGGGEALVGATGLGIFLAGEIIAFTAKPKGAEVALGKGMGTIECRKTVLAVHAPISFTLFEGNEAEEERPALVGKEPHGAGWMVRARPTAWETEAAGLIDADAYRRHILAIEPEARFE